MEHAAAIPLLSLLIEFLAVRGRDYLAAELPPQVFAVVFYYVSAAVHLWIPAVDAEYYCFFHIFSGFFDLIFLIIKSTIVIMIPINI